MFNIIVNFNLKSEDEDEEGSIYANYYDRLTKEDRKISKKMHIQVPSQKEVILSTQSNI